jgi:hypothetical protein
VNRVLKTCSANTSGTQPTKNWDLSLLAEFAINHSHHEFTGSTPFRLNTGMDPRMPVTVSTHGSKVPAAGEFVGVMETELKEAKLRLQQAQQRMKA